MEGWGWQKGLFCKGVELVQGGSFTKGQAALSSLDIMTGAASA